MVGLLSLDVLDSRQTSRPAVTIHLLVASLARGYNANKPLHVRKLASGKHRVCEGVLRVRALRWLRFYAPVAYETALAPFGGLVPVLFV